MLHYMYMKHIRLMIAGGIVLSLFIGIPALAQQVDAQTIEQLMARLQQLQAELAALKQNMPQESAVSQSDDSGSWCYEFRRNFRTSDQGTEVAALQRALASEGFVIDEDEVDGKRFGDSTADAVTGFQQKYQSEVLTPSGLKYGTGYVGPATRKKLNALYVCGARPSPIAISPPIAVEPSISDEPNILPYVQNPSFELSQAVREGRAWVRGGYFLDGRCALDIVDGVARTGARSAKISCPTENDAYWLQKVAVEPNTDYIFSGWIKTENVSRSWQAYGAGANLSIFGTWTHSPALFGTNDWMYKTVSFNSGASRVATIAIRIGLASGVTTGTAWFDDIKLERADGVVIPPPPDITQPTITIVSPRGGEVLRPDDTLVIDWTSVGIPQAANVSVGAGVVSSLDPLRDVPFAIVPPSQPRVTWQLGPDVVSGTYRAYVMYRREGAAPLIVYSNTFSVIGKTPPPQDRPAITVLSPNGGERWEKGATKTIRWTSSNVSQIYIKLRKGSVGDTIRAVSAVVPNQNYYQWIVPPDLPDGNDYTVRVIDAVSLTLDDSNSPFTISGSSDSVELPNPQLIFTGIENYIDYYGSPYVRYKLDVTNWSQYPAELFTLAPDLPPCGLNNNSSRTWVNIYNAATNAYLYGFCGFTATQSLSSLWFGVLQGSTPPQSVYITINDRRTGATYRSNTVSVSTTGAASVAVLSPNGGEKWQAGSTQTVRWSGGSPNWTVAVDLRQTPTSQGVQTSPNISNSGSYTFSVSTNVPPGQYYIYIVCQSCQVGTQGAGDWSDAPFSIVSGTVSKPDMVVKGVTPFTSTLIASGVNVQLCNDGSASTGTFPVRIVANGVTQDFTFPTLSVSPGGCAPNAWDGSMWNMTAGRTYTITAIADPNNNISESNEANNTFTTSVTLPTTLLSSPQPTPSPTPSPTVSCPSPYHVLASDGRCVWSCGVGTQPDGVTNECKCQSGYTQTNTDSFGRRTCTASSTPPTASALEALRTALSNLRDVLIGFENH